VSRLRRLELAVSAPWLLGRALRSYRRAERLGAPGLDFARFGRRTGINLLLRGDPGGPALLLTPVNIVRYWEFSFAWEALAGRGGRCLDVASPRLFSIRVASSRNGVHVRMINPDGQDACVTRRFARRLNLTQLAVEALPVEELDDRRYDLIWSISVLEHIAGDRGDTEAIRRLYGALAPGGRLIVTVPVARKYEIEMREHDEYGLGTPGAGGTYFFQRLYDEAAIHRRLIEPSGGAATQIEWWGERTPGRFRAYEKRWIAEDHRCTVDDPEEVAREYRTYRTWGEMPGLGVCGIVMDKP